MKHARALYYGDGDGDGDGDLRETTDARGGVAAGANARPGDGVFGGCADRGPVGVEGWAGSRINGAFRWNSVRAFSMRSEARSDAAWTACRVSKGGFFGFGLRGKGGKLD